MNTRKFYETANILERLILVAATVVLMFPALISGYVLPYEQRWWGYLVGIALFGIAFLSQKVRYGAKKKNQAAVAESDEELAVSERGRQYRRAQYRQGSPTSAVHTEGRSRK